MNFNNAFYKAKHLIIEKYNISVREDILSYPKTGEFDGTSISIHPYQNAENKLFLLVHLFGHNVQWIVNDEWRNLGLSQPDFSNFEKVRAKYIDALPKIHQYEYEACQYGLQLLHEAGITEFDQWISDMANADWAYLQDCYLKGYSKERHDNFLSLYFKENSKLINPIPIPYFTPVWWDSKYAF